MTMEINVKDEMVMKLLHYFITEKNYNPVVLHGAQEEIWLENMDNDYKIVRIVSNYIHNNEQLDFDLFKTQKIVSNIKKKTLNLNMNVLSIYVDLGDNVNLDTNKNNTMTCVNLTNEKDISNISRKQYFRKGEMKTYFDPRVWEIITIIENDYCTNHNGHPYHKKDHEHRVGHIFARKKNTRLVHKYYYEIIGVR